MDGCAPARRAGDAESQLARSSYTQATALKECRYRRKPGCDTGGVLTAFGAIAVTFMMLMYALEHRGLPFILAFACGCALSSAYGFLAGTWPFGAVEAIWAAIAVRRWHAKASSS